MRVTSTCSTAAAGTARKAPQYRAVSAHDGRQNDQQKAELNALA